MKHFCALFSVFLVVFLLSCNKSGTSNNNVQFEMEDEGETIVLRSDTSIKHDYLIKTNNIVLCEGELTNEDKFNILDLLQVNEDRIKEIALLTMKSDGIIPIHITVHDQIDTMINYKVPYESFTTETVHFSGPGAELSSSSAGPNDIVELKRWLFNKNHYLPDSLIQKMTAYYRTLMKSGYDDYKPKTAIPVLKSVEGKSYRINSDMKADYYAMVACSTQAFIDKYVESIVSNDFAGTVTSLSQSLICHQKKGSSGYKCLVLIGINKDWSYTQQPIGVVAIDNEPPSINSLLYVGLNNEKTIINTNEKNVNSIHFKNGQRILLPEDKPRIYGGANINISNWAGSLYMCNVTFKILVSGDVKAITIVRNRNLCGDYSSFFGYDDGVGPTRKIIYAKDINGLHEITMKMHFERGNNHIPIEIEDYNGNVTKYEIIQHASFVNTNTPSIDIENNINIDNY